MIGILEGITRWRAQMKRAVLADMHRIACGTAGCALPLAPLDETPPGAGRSPLRFSLRRRKRLSWNIFLCGSNHCGS